MFVFTRYTLNGEVIVQGTYALLHRTFRSGYLETITHPYNQATFTRANVELDRIRVSDEQDMDIRTLRQTLIDQTLGATYST